MLEDIAQSSEFPPELIHSVLEFLKKHENIQNDCLFCFFAFYIKLIDLMCSQDRIYDESFYKDAVQTYNHLKMMYWIAIKDNIPTDFKSNYFYTFEKEIERLIGENDLNFCYPLTLCVLHDNITKYWFDCGETMPSKVHSQTFSY